MDKKRLVIGTISFLIVLGTVCLTVKQHTAIFSSANGNNTGRTIIVDAGHGGLTNTID